MLLFSWAHSRKKLARLPSDATISTRLDALQWVCLNRHHTSLFGFRAPEWADLEHDERAELVKSNPIRRIYHIHSSEYDFHAKIIRPLSLKDRLKWWIRSCPSQIEFENLQIARGRWIPVIQPIAWASSSVKKLPYGILVTKTIKSACSFDEFLSRTPQSDPQSVYNALTAIARTVGKLHCGCIQHLDLHPQNFLLAPPAEDASDDIPNAYISDFQRIRIDHKGGHASADPYSRWRIANVGMLLSGLRKKINLDQQKHFAAQYIQTVQPHNPWDSHEIEEYFQQARFWADQYERKITRPHERSALKDTKNYSQLKLNSGWYARVFLQAQRPSPAVPASQYQFTEKHWRQALKQPLSLLESDRVLKKEEHAMVVAGSLTVADKVMPVVIKQTITQKGPLGFLQALQTSRSLRQWHRAHMLLKQGLPTPWPLAALEQYSGPFRRQCLYITSAIPQSQTLHALIKQNRLPRDIPARRLLTDQIARLLALLVVKGFRHHACTADHILIEHRPHARSPYLPYLINLDGLRRNWFNLSKDKHIALIRLAASCLTLTGLSRTDYARLFHRYLQFLKLPQASHRSARHTLWRTLIQNAQNKTKN